MSAAAATLDRRSLPRLADLLRQSDILLALGIVSILIVLFLPLPALLLDLMLAVSITMSVLVLMTALFIERPLEFNVFPTVLLITTMLRLALNLASTRLILTHGHTGTDAAGNVIRAFGNFVMQGNPVVGVIVFAILVVVNFVVITKGSSRIAEVAARFSLDAMPGKQMAIDADLSAGLIDEAGARERRRLLEEESAFFGAMDGAAKFVRGDAVAGLLITAINLMGGFVIGVAQKGLSLADAASSYTVLSVGDGLVSQIPALIVSTAAGLLVTKSGVRNRADQALFGQLGAFPRAMGVTSVLTGALALLPGLPAVPFALLALGSGWLAWRGGQRKGAGASAAAPEQPPPKAEDSAAASLAIDTLRLELGYGLLSLIGDGAGRKLPDQIKSLRRELANDFGLVMPSVRIQDNIQLPAQTYVIRLKEIEVGRGELRPGMLLVMDPQGGTMQLPGESTIEPTFGLPAAWVSASLREEALTRGYTVVDCASVLTTHLTEIVKDNLPELLSFGETQKLLAGLGEDYHKLVADLVPARIPAAGVQRVLQGLLAERVSIRDLGSIVEAIAEASAHTSSALTIIEHVRTRLARQISNACTAPGGAIPVVSLSPEWEQAFAESIIGQGDDRQLALAPTRLQQFAKAVAENLESHAMRGEIPVLVTTPPVRPFVRAVVERIRPSTTVLSHNEIHPKARITSLGQLQ
jgi:flagellar biosynthesis protein FlhA